MESRNFTDKWWKLIVLFDLIKYNIDSKEYSIVSIISHIENDYKVVT